MTYRTLGKTGQKVFAIGLGGAQIGRAASPEIATREAKPLLVETGG
jgi:aryl-alcohol dehydrogenase-like predicted oxidoreductase